MGHVGRYVLGKNEWRQQGKVARNKWVPQERERQRGCVVESAKLE